MRTASCIHPVLVLWTCMFACIPLVQGEETPLCRRVSVRYDNKPLAEALQDLGEKAGVRFSGLADLPETDRMVTYRAENKAAGRIATRILMPRGVTLQEANGSSPAVVRLGPMHEFKVKPEPVFEFEEKPRIERGGDRTTITFASRGWCDATVTIEEKGGGKIHRHLASGVLGINAPEPFQWNSKKQVLVWDGKDDQGKYVRNPENTVVRVSLGLKPLFERTLFWSPEKRLGEGQLSICPAPEGVYVHDPSRLAQLRLFDHEGRYVRTVYPFPSEKLDEVTELKWQACPQDGLRIPLRYRCSYFYPDSMLPMTPNTMPMNKTRGCLAVHGNRVFLVSGPLFRLASDGSSGGLPVMGPKVSFHVYRKIWAAIEGDVNPSSVAFSPDGRRLYVTGYHWSSGFHAPYEWLNGVRRLDAEAPAEKPDPKAKKMPGPDPEMPAFVGRLMLSEWKADRCANGGGTEPGQFRCATSVACDSKGRVYVTDHMNDRVQVFSPEGEFLKAFSVRRPSVVAIHPKNGEIYVFSWRMSNQWYSNDGALWSRDKVKPVLTRFGPFEDPKTICTYALPMPELVPDGGRRRHLSILNTGITAALDFWTKPVTLWFAPRNSSMSTDESGWHDVGIMVYTLGEKNLVLKKDFSKVARRNVVRMRPPSQAMGRLSVNPKTGNVFLCEGGIKGGNMYFREIWTVSEIDPETGRVRATGAPTRLEDMCFDMEGHAVMRSNFHVVRYDLSNPGSWREVPWDYGERVKPWLGALAVPGSTCGGGFGVSPNGNLAVTHQLSLSVIDNINVNHNRWGMVDTRAIPHGTSKPYKPAIYQGRGMGKRCVLVHIFDRAGKLVSEDVLQGFGDAKGLRMDRHNDLYILSGGRRAIGGKPLSTRAGGAEPALLDSQYGRTGTLMKFRPGRGKLLASAKHAKLPLPPDALPERHPEVVGSNPRWVEGAEWMYGGVGLPMPGGCWCSQSRFDLDLFGRSFVPEAIRGKIAVLDANGNLVLRVGQLGNVDDGKPLIPDGGPPNTRSIGGDETALFWPANVATHSDRRLFIHDWGNARIVSVKLGYHAEECVELGDVSLEK